MLRTVCHHAEDSLKCCIAGILELTNREFEMAAELAVQLKDRGLQTLTVPILTGQLDEDVLRTFRDLGFWILTGPSTERPVSAVMLGDRFYHKPCDRVPFDITKNGDWLMTLLVPFNPMFVRRHVRPTA